METIPKEIIKKIIEYIRCKKYSKCFLVNKNFNQMFIKEKIVYFKDTNICCEHYDKDLIEIIKILNTEYRCGGMRATFHFKSNELVKKAIPYIKKYFGPISHECCGGKGVMTIASTQKKGIGRIMIKKD